MATIKVKEVLHENIKVGNIYWRNGKWVTAKILEDDDDLRRWRAGDGKMRLVKVKSRKTK
jgi:hypothetical protein